MMNIVKAHSWEPTFDRNTMWWVCALAILSVICVGAATGVEVDGFTEPHRTIHVASSETGIIKQLQVEEGDVVQQGQVLAELDDEVHRALLEIAKKAMNATGRLESALADVDLKQVRLHKLEDLRAAGHARQEEVDRARTELAVAEGQLKAVQEDLLIKRLEHAKIEVQLRRRSIRSPIQGVVSETHKDLGEFVAPNSPEVLTIVELDPLLATFSIPSPQAARLKVGGKMKVKFPSASKPVEGVIQFIAPTTDAESGTVRMKVRIENSRGKCRSGERCVVNLPEKK